MCPHVMDAPLCYTYALTFDDVTPFPLIRLHLRINTWIELHVYCKHIKNPETTMPAHEDNPKTMHSTV